MSQSIQSIGIDTACDCCQSVHAGPNAAYLTNTLVYTHENQRAAFYRDLIQGKIVLINLMSIAGERGNPVTAQLARTQTLLAPRLGKDVFMYSLTTDPEADSPRALRRFAEEHQVQPGWQFLTGDPDSVRHLIGRIFGHAGLAHQNTPIHESLTEGQHCALGLIRYGNEAAGVWASAPTIADPHWIAERIRWITPRPQTKTPRRAGPAPLSQADPVTARIRML